MRKPLATLAVLVAATGLLAACGDDGGSDSSVDTDSGGSGAETTVELQDFQFSPDSVAGAAGETLSIDLENTGDATHTFTGEGVDETLAPGDTKTVEVALPDSGDFEFFCRFHGSRGMTGTITTGGATPGGGGNDPAPSTEPSTTSGGGYGGY
jgi:plastocyanin